jgi:hypothetical protein
VAMTYHTADLVVLVSNEAIPFCAARDGAVAAALAQLPSGWVQAP